MRIVPSILIPLLAWSLLSAAEPVLTTSNKVSFKGVGAVKVGMTLEKLKSSIGFPLVVDDDLIGGESRSAYPSPNPYGINFVIDFLGVLTQISFSKPGFQTISGIQVGDTEKKVRGVYSGKLKVWDHHYIENGHVFSLHSADGKYAIVFDTDGERITSYRVGFLGDIESPE